MAYICEICLVLWTFNFMKWWDFKLFHWVFQDMWYKYHMFGKMVKKTLKSNGIFQFCAILPLLNTNLFFTFWLCLHWFHMCYFYQEFHFQLLLTLLFLSLFLALVERSHNKCMIKPVDVFLYYSLSIILI